MTDLTLFPFFVALAVAVTHVLSNAAYLTCFRQKPIKASNLDVQPKPFLSVKYTTVAGFSSRDEP